MKSVPTGFLDDAGADIMGLAFKMRLLTRDSACAAVEAPTYDRMVNTLRRARVETASIDRGADGLDSAEARRLFTQRARPSFLYTMPTFHNPTWSLTMTREQREELASLIVELDVIVVEDDPDGAVLGIDGEPIPRLHEVAVPKEAQTISQSC